MGFTKKCATLLLVALLPFVTISNAAFAVERDREIVGKISPELLESLRELRLNAEGALDRRSGEQLEVMPDYRSFFKKMPLGDGELQSILGRIRSGNCKYGPNCVSTAEAPAEESEDTAAFDQKRWKAIIAQMREMADAHEDTRYMKRSMRFFESRELVLNDISPAPEVGEFVSRMIRLSKRPLTEEELDAALREQRFAAERLRADRIKSLLGIDRTGELGETFTPARGAWIFTAYPYSKRLFAPSGQGSPDAPPALTGVEGAQ